MANSQKMERRKKAGDDPTALSKSNASFAGAIPAQPMPGMAQGPGNAMMNPGNTTSASGTEAPYPSFNPKNPQSAYGDNVFDASVKQRMGSNSLVINTPSGRNQNDVSGTGFNTQPLSQNAGINDAEGQRLEPFYNQQQAAERAAKLYGKGELPYAIGFMGMTGRPVPTQGAIDPMNPGQSADYLGLTGMPDAQQAGMNMGTGGRNQPKGAA